MAPPASIIVPTRNRADYLDVALRSIAPQAAAAGAEMLVVDDGPDDATRAASQRHGARYTDRTAGRGLNAARNAGLDEAASDLMVFVDDDVAVHPGWLDALLAADREAEPDVAVLTGPIHARLEGRRLRTCGREKPPITTQDFGSVDRDVEHAWGANMTVRRAALARAGRFDETHVGAGDEEAWERRLRERGGRIRYVAGAALDHRRTPRDARLPALLRAAHARGATARRFDVREGRAPSLLRELRILAGCVWHTLRHACALGAVSVAHSWGRTRVAVRPQPPPAIPGVDDFLAGRSGTVGGRRARLRQLLDRALDLEAARRIGRLDHAAAGGDRRRIVVTGVERPDRLMGAARAELERSRHAVDLRTVPMTAGGKFAHVNRALEQLGDCDWLLICDDDVVLPPGFLDRFVHVAERAGLKLAQPAHRLHSHAAWPVTVRRPGAAARLTHFVEIGPVTALHRDVLAELVPFPDLEMGWGLDAHWSAVALQRGWPIGVVDVTPVLHTTPVGGHYDRETAIGEARAFLADRPYVTRDEARWSRRI